MKNTLIAIAIILASCTQEEPYFIDSTISTELVGDYLNISVSATATNKVKNIYVYYSHKLSPYESILNRTYVNPYVDQKAIFVIDRGHYIEDFHIEIVDTEGNTKTFKL